MTSINFGRVLAVLFVFLFLLEPRSFADLTELTITNDPVKKAIKISALKVDVKIFESTALATYEITFVNKRSKNRDGTFHFALPPNSYVHDFGIWIDDFYQRSAIIEARDGRIAFENSSQENSDPALLNWTGDNTFKIQVRPILSNKKTKIKLVIGMPASLVGGQLTYKLPLDVGKIKKLTVKVRGEMVAETVPKVIGLKPFILRELKDKKGGRKFFGTYTKTNVQPPTTFKIVIPDPAVEKYIVRRENAVKKRFFEARFYPKLSKKERPTANKAIVYWDFSLSEANSHQEKLEILKIFLKSKKQKSVEIYGFNQQVFPLEGSFNSGNFNKIKTALSRPYDGATRLDLLATHMQTNLSKISAKTNLILFTNAADSFEISDFKNLKNMPTQNLQSFLVSPTAKSNTDLIMKFETALDAVHIDQDSIITDATFSEYPWTIASIDGSKNVRKIEHNPAPIFPGNGVAIWGYLRKDRKSNITINFKRGAETKSVKYSFHPDDIVEGNSHTIGKLWSKARIARLSSRMKKNSIKIKNLGLTHQLMTPYTIMVVLEFCDDYFEFKLNPPDDCRTRPADSFVVDFQEENEDDDQDFKNTDLEDPKARYKFSASKFLLDSLQEDAAKVLHEKRTADFASEDYDRSEALGDEIFANDEYDDTQNNGAMQEQDSQFNAYGFEKKLLASKKLGVTRVYSDYLKLRAAYIYTPYYYIFAADLFMSMERFDLAKLVLSNIVEIRPKNARWMSIYAFNLLAWGQSAEAVTIYRAFEKLHDNDPRVQRDYGLALEAIGKTTDAMKLFAKVYRGKWNNRLKGIRDIVRHDLSRTAIAVKNSRTTDQASKRLAQSHVNADNTHNDKIVITASWDTTNTDIDLHVIEPDGAHLFFGQKKVKSSNGKLSLDAKLGYGPEQYRNRRPYRGDYRIYLKYFSKDPSVIRDGTFARVEFKVYENGAARNFTETVFLNQNKQIKTVLNLNFQDRQAPVAPINFNHTIAKVKSLLRQSQFAAAKLSIKSLGIRKTKKEEAYRYLYLALAEAGLKRYDEAERFNKIAYSLNNRLLTAIYNNACYGALKKNPAKSLRYLIILADAIKHSPSKQRRYIKLIQTDKRLLNIRQSAGYKSVKSRFIAH